MHIKTNKKEAEFYGGGPECISQQSILNYPNLEVTRDVYILFNEKRILLKHKRNDYMTPKTVEYNGS